MEFGATFDSGFFSLSYSELLFPLSTAFNTHFQTVLTAAAVYLGQLLTNGCKSLPDRLATLLLSKMETHRTQIAQEIFYFPLKFLITLMFVTFLEFIHVYHTGQFAQPFWNITEKCIHYYDHRSIWWFCNFKTSCCGETTQSLTQECTKPKGQKLSLGTHPQRLGEVQTHTQKNVFTQNLRFCSWAHLDHHSQNPQFQLCSPTPRGVNELAFSKHSWSLLFSSDFTSFAQYMRELEPFLK